MIWQRTMDQILQEISMTRCYLYDVIISGKDEKEHLKNLEKVLTRFEKWEIKLNKNKCEFMKDKVIYCELELSENGIRKTNERIEPILKLPAPKNISQLRSFCGMINFYRPFIANLSEILKPLFELT